VKKHRTLLITLIVTALVGAGIYNIYHGNGFEEVVRIINNKIGRSKNSSKAKTFNKQQYPVDNPSSQWVVVNKMRQLNPIDYAPAQLVDPDIKLRFDPAYSEMLVSTVIAAPLKQLVEGASKDGLSLMLASGYRSYLAQQSIYNISVNDIGQAATDQQNARPGYSEHQTGLAVDMEPTSRNCETLTCFADTPEGKWLADNAYKYGFIIRYPQNKQNVTGYSYEPWHIRYVGIDLSTQMHSSHIETLEEFFGLLSAPNYN